MKSKFLPGFTAATAAYEAWLGERLGPRLEQDALDFKHHKMRGGAFPFLRATFYRWAQLWPLRAGALARATPILSVGDLHVENFGTWRDIEGRLVWGINDFDEAAVLPWTSDLVRLGTSAAIMSHALGAGDSIKECLAAILDGYRSAMERPEKARPFVLSGEHEDLNALVRKRLDPAAKFWRDFHKKETRPAEEIPPSARAALEAELPQGATDFVLLRPRKPKGLGSLGRPRFFATGMWNGACVARETKALVPSAVRWAAGDPNPDIEIGALLATARRSPDPWFDFRGSWLVRRLAPDAVKIELEDLIAAEDAKVLGGLFWAMGAETANIHLGSQRAERIAAELAGYASNWFQKSVETWVHLTVEDYESYVSPEEDIA